MDQRASQTGSPYLIEINPRATQVGHLTLGPGRDLPAALYAAVSGQIVQPALKVTEKDTITLFPREWITNPASAFLRTGYHDVPWEEPQLVRACAAKAGSGALGILNKTGSSLFRRFSSIRCPYPDEGSRRREVELGNRVSVDIHREPTSGQSGESGFEGSSDRFEQHSFGASLNPDGGELSGLPELPRHPLESRFQTLKTGADL